MVKEQISSQSKIGKTIIHVYNETIWYVGSDKNNVEIIQQDQRYLLWTFTTVLYYELISLLELILLAFST